MGGNNSSEPTQEGVKGAIVSSVLDSDEAKKQKIKQTSEVNVTNACLHIGTRKMSESSPPPPCSVKSNADLLQTQRLERQRCAPHEVRSHQATSPGETGPLRMCLSFLALTIGTSDSTIVSVTPWRQPHWCNTERAWLLCSWRHRFALLGFCLSHFQITAFKPKCLRCNTIYFFETDD